MLINPKRLEHLKTLYIGHNYIDDEGFAHILQSPLQNLHILRIADTDITVKSLRLLENRTFSVLEHLDLAGLPLGDKGVEVLTKIDAKRLKILVLERCEIKSLEKFNQMQFPLVYQLFISYNDFDVQEIIDFFSHLDRKNWASLWKVEANGYSPTIAQ
jgi:Ran GTPase-activating protein (RanGAP) involved in mRNA processing and transport